MDITTISTMVTPDMFQNVGDMLQLAMACCDQPPKQIAAEIGYSVDSIYAAVKNIRPIPAKARQKIAGINVIAAAAVALESTGFTRLFGYQKVDRHVQSMIVRLKKQSKDVNSILDELPVLLLDKNSRNDLTDEDLETVTIAAYKIVDQTNASFNLIMELEAKYGLGLAENLQGKEKIACAGTQTISRKKLTN